MKSNLVREGERLDRAAARAAAGERAADAAANATWDPARYVLVDGIPVWVRAAMRGPLGEGGAS